MKKIILAAGLCLLCTALITPSFAQENNVEDVENAIRPDGKYAMSVNSSKHLKIAVMTGQELKKQFPEIQFQVILSGPVLKELSQSDELGSVIDQAQENGIPVVACAIALKGQSIDPKTLPKYVQVSKNAAIYIFGLEELGYKVL